MAPGEFHKRDKARTVSIETLVIPPTKNYPGEFDIDRFLENSAEAVAALTIEVSEEVKMALMKSIENAVGARQAVQKIPKFEKSLMTTPVGLLQLNPDNGVILKENLLGEHEELNYPEGAELKNIPINNQPQSHVLAFQNETGEQYGVTWHTLGRTGFAGLLDSEGNPLEGQLVEYGLPEKTALGKVNESGTLNGIWFIYDYKGIHVFLGDDAGHFVELFPDENLKIAVVAHFSFNKEDGKVKTVWPIAQDSSRAA